MFNLKQPLSAASSLLIGLGDFGSLWAQLLLERTDYKLLIYDKDLNKAQDVYKKLILRKELASRLQLLTSVSQGKPVLSEVKAVFFAVPPQYFEHVVNEWANLLPDGTILVDVLSVKVYPFKIFANKNLKRFKKVLMHPMFGPNAIKSRSTSWPIVYWPIPPENSLNNEDQNSASQLEKWTKELITSLQMTPVKLDPYEHDKAMAYTQFLAHLFGVLGNKLASKIYQKYKNIMPGSAKKLMDLTSLAIDLSDEVFKAMYTFNPFAKEAIADLLKFTLEQLNAFYQHSESLEKQRELIDIIDELVLYLFALRLRTVKRIKHIKDKLGIGVVDKKRYQEHLNSLVKVGKKLDLSKEFIKDFYDLLHDESVRFQNNVN